MTRFKAFLIHLGISSAIFLVLLYLIVFVWYPIPYFAADGGWQGIRIIAGVDLVLGPLLTLIVFRSGKKRLKLDLALIGLVQAAALAWGTLLVYEERTALVTYAHDAFYTLTSAQIETAGGQAPAVAAASTAKPPLAFVRLPADRKTRSNFVMRAVFAGRTLHQLGDQYEPMNPDNRKEVIAHSLDIGKFAEVSAENREKIERFLKKRGGSAGDYAFLPLYGRDEHLILVLRRQDGEVAGALTIWPQLPRPASAEAAPSTPPARK